MHTILIPYDFSESAKNAADYALALFVNRPTRFIFAHFFETMGDTKVTPELKDEFTESQLSRSVEKHSASAAHPHHRFEQMVVWEDVIRGIGRLAAEHSADAIFMGTKGKSNIMSQIMGSKTSGVIERATVPVMAIPLSARYDGFRKMVLGTDFKPVNRFESYDYFMKLLGPSNAEFIVLNVSTEKEPATMEQTMSGVTLDRSLSRRPHRYDFVYDDSPVKGLLEYVEKNEVDLLAMLKRDHFLIRTALSESVVGKMLLDIQTPLLSLPDVQKK